jgi:hypothetical protein
MLWFLFKELGQWTKFKLIALNASNTVKSPLKVSLRSSGFEYQTEENVEWRKLSEIIDLESLKLNVKWEKS